MYLVAMINGTIHQKQIKRAEDANRLIAKARKNHWLTYGRYPTITWKVINSDSITDAFKAGEELKAAPGV